MVEQQVLIDQLQDKLEKFTVTEVSVTRGPCSDTPAPALETSARPYSVPLTNSLLYSFHVPSGIECRKVHTSPPVYSLAQVMAGFRTRSQMMLSYIEEQDEVLHSHFSDEEEKNTDSKKKPAFRHSINHTWTRKQAALCSPLEMNDLQCQIYKSRLPDKTMLQTDTVTGEEIVCIRKSQVLNMQKLKNSELRLTEAKQKMRGLELNIRMKEELIKELVKTGNDAQSVSRKYSLKITKLEQEAEQAKMELAETQKQLQEVENKELRDVAEKAKLQKEFRKKMDAAKMKVQVLQKKQEDTKKLASLSTQNERRATELEQNVTHMRHQKAQLQKRLHEESEKKKLLEAEIQRDQQQIKELQLKMEQQQKILKLKNEEIAAFKKNSTGTPQQLQELEEQKKWLDEELEKVLNQRQELAQLEEDLKKREAIITKKEELFQEKSHLEIKKLRSSQEEHVLFQLEEGIEALEAAIDYKNESIQNRQHLLRASSQILSQSEANVMGKLISLSAVDLRAILCKYFNKVVGLREAERKLQLQTEELEMRVTEQDNIIRELESVLEHLKLQCDKQLTLQQKEHEQKMQLVLHHFKEQDGEGIAETLKMYEGKVQQLEKDLFFYKKTSRDLKKKVKELVGEPFHQLLAPTKCHGAGDRTLSQDEAEVSSEEVKCISKTESNNQRGIFKEIDKLASNLRTWQNSYKPGEEVAERGHSRRCFSSSENSIGTDEVQPSKSYSQLFSHPQTVEIHKEVQGIITPIKLSRRELRHIPASEVSLRRSSLAAGVSSVAADSFDISRKSDDFKR